MRGETRPQRDQIEARRGEADPARRRFLWLMALAPVLALGAHWTSAASAAKKATTLEPTPDCGDDDEPTPSETEGPFFKPRSPLRASGIESLDSASWMTGTLEAL